jgi:hypothetical protein
MSELVVLNDARGLVVTLNSNAMAIWQNSDQSIVEEIPAGNTYTAPDVNNIDSDGTEVPTPAGVAFVATPCGVFSFAGAELGEDNTYIDLYFTEAIYNTALANGALEVADLNLAFAANGGAATAASISSLTKLDGTTALEGGEIGIRAFISITGTPNGLETITISPVLDSVFDADGVAMDVGENVSVTLNDQSTSVNATEAINNIESNSGETLTTAERDIVIAIVDAMDWAETKSFIFYSAFGSQAKNNADWKKLTSAVPVNAPTFDPTIGYGPLDGSSQYIDNNDNPFALSLSPINLTIGVGVGGTVGSGVKLGLLNTDSTIAYGISNVATNNIGFRCGALSTDLVGSGAAPAINSRYYGKGTDLDMTIWKNGIQVAAAGAPSSESTILNGDFYTGAWNRLASPVNGHDTSIFTFQIAATKNFNVANFDTAIAAYL